MRGNEAKSRCLFSLFKQFPLKSRQQLLIFFQIVSLYGYNGLSAKTIFYMPEQANADALYY